MTRDSHAADSARWQDAATIAALLTCYDVWSATPQRDCAAELLRTLGPTDAR